MLDSFDRTCITTTDSQGPDREDLRGKCPTDMDDKAVNYLVKTPGGNIYHSGDSHYSIYYAKNTVKITILMLRLDHMEKTQLECKIK